MLGDAVGHGVFLKDNEVVRVVFGADRPVRDRVGLGVRLGRSTDLGQQRSRLVALAS